MSSGTPRDWSDSKDLDRTLVRLDQDELEFLRDTFAEIGESPESHVCRSPGYCPGDVEAFDQADRCQDELERRRHGRVVTSDTR